MNETPNSPPHTLEPPISTGTGPANGAAWGPFALREMVGQGSFGQVYRAWDSSLEREVALKILRPRPSGAGARFEDSLREARALASVRHPNIVPVYGVDRHDGQVGFWTDFVHGKTLAQLVREQGPLGYREAALIGLDMLKALSAVHRAGLLHRDIKAENVMREEGGRILLMDFGLCTLPFVDQNLAGTPRYMAPELFAGQPATVASDIYATGVLLFFLVAGKFPALHSEPTIRPKFEAGGEEPTAAAPVPCPVPDRIQGLPASLSGSRSVLDYRADIPTAFARVVETAMQPEARRRYASAGAMSSALAEVLASPVDGPARRLPSGRRWLYAAALTVLLLGLGSAGYLRYGGRARTGPAPSPIAAPAVNEMYLKAEALLQRSDKRKNVADATVLLRQVLARQPDFGLAQAGLGRAEFLEYRVTRQAGLLDEARAASNRAIEIDSSLAPPHVTLARIEAMAGNTALATQEVQTALRLDPHNAEAYGAQSEVFDAEGRSVDALAAARKAMDLAPDYWRWPVLLGHYYFVDGRLAEAAAQFRKAVEMAPDNAIALLDLGLASLQLGHFEEARASLQKSADLQPSFAAYSALAEVLTAQGKLPESVTMYQKAVELNPTNYAAWGNLASGYLWSPGGHEKAMEAYRKAIDLAEVTRKETPKEPVLLSTLGGYYAFAGDPGRALPLLRQAVALAPGNPSVLFVAGDGYEILHDRAQAIQLIARALALGYHADQLDRSPELAALRADPRFRQALDADRAKDALDSKKRK